MGEMYSITGGGMVKIDQDKWAHLRAGTVLHMNGYSYDDFVIIKKMEGCSFYDTVNLRTFEQSNKACYSLKHISERQDDRIQVYVTDKILDAEAIMDAIDKNKLREVQKGLDKLSVEKKAIEDRERLLKEYSHLEAVPEGSYETRKIGAKNIRKELKKQFPGHKFSVRGKSFSGGDDIFIEYALDFPEEGVEWIKSLCNRYQQGTFNGMDDLYTYGHGAFTSLFGGAKYVMSQRAWK